MGRFVNRDRELAKFVEVLTAQEQRATLIVVSGVSKIGKTSLLRQFERKCKDLQVACVYLRLTSRRSIQSLVEMLVDGLVSRLAVGSDRIFSVRNELHQLVAESIAESAAQGMGTVRSEDVRLARLRQVLTSRFSDSELRDLCFDLDIAYDDLPGEGRADKARELVAYLNRRNWISRLVETVELERADIRWQDATETLDVPPALYNLSFGRELARNLTDGLRRLDVSRLVILLDGYERACYPVKRWIENALLDCIQRDPRTVVVLAVEDEAEFDVDHREELDLIWDGMVSRLPLGPITDMDAWLERAELAGIPNENANIVRYLYHRHGGDPKAMSAELDQLERLHRAGLLRE
jgi:hypothetical protein